MDEREIKRLLQSQSDRPAKRGWRCPDDNQLAAYVAGRFDDTKRKTFESHTADCDWCLGAIAFLAQAADWPTGSEVPPHLVSRARKLVSEKPPTVWRWRWAMATAAAACAVLLVAFLVFRSRPEQSTTHPGSDLVAQQQSEPPAVQPTVSIKPPNPTTPQGQKPKPTEALAAPVRGGTEPQSPTLLFPREDAALTSNQLNFRWKPLPGAVSYEIKVATETGGLAFAETTSQLQFRASDKQLPPGKYFVTVVAHLPDGHTARSRMVPFRLVE